MNISEQELCDVIKGCVVERIDLGRDYSDDEIRQLIREQIRVQSREIPLSYQSRKKLENRIFNSMRKMDVIQELLEEDDISEIMINGPDDIFYEKYGELHRFPGKFSTEEKLMDLIQNIVSRHNRVVNQSSPIVDTRLEDGSRVNIVLPPVSLSGPSVTIRRFPDHPITMEKLIEMHSISNEAAEFLQTLVSAGYSIFISGGTGSGKTTLLNALSQYIPAGERIVTIEDSAELQLRNASNLVRLETRNMNVEGMKEITMRDLIRTALRMRPDRIILGECRGAEALDMLTAMNTGHDGSISTGHGNSCKDMLARLEMMVKMGEADLSLEVIRAQIASGINIMIQLGRLRDHSRRVLEISELLGLEGGEITLNSLFCFREKGVNRKGGIIGELEPVGSLLHREKLAAAGLEIAGGL